MTENEIKSKLEVLKEWVGDISLTRQDMQNVIDEVIKSLEELKQYRAIGTVEDLKTMKENGAFTGVELASLACMQMKLRDYQAIGTVEELKALKERNKPAKVIEHKTQRLTHWLCGNCGSEFYSGQTFCDECGYPADWGDLLV